MATPSPESAGVLKKGAWTKEEDEILCEYVRKYGAKDWSSVCSRTDLVARCGKSCRLRWVNHLRPNLRKDAFTPEEEELVVELQAKHGNKWALIASSLKGRTDNCVKNLWNTRLRKKRTHAQRQMQHQRQQLPEPFSYSDDQQLRKRPRTDVSDIGAPLTPLWASEMDFGMPALMSPSSTLDCQSHEPAVVGIKGEPRVKGEDAPSPSHPGSSGSSCSRTSQEGMDFGMDQLGSCDSRARAPPIEHPFVGVREGSAPQSSFLEPPEGGVIDPAAHMSEGDRQVQRRKFIDSLRLPSYEFESLRPSGGQVHPTPELQGPIMTPGFLPSVSPLTGKLGLEWLNSPGLVAPPLTPAHDPYFSAFNTPKFFSPPPMSPMVFDALRTPSYFDFQLSPLLSKTPTGDSGKAWEESNRAAKVEVPFSQQ